MRWHVLLVALCACAPSWRARSHLGSDGTPRGAREIELRCHDDGTCRGTKRGVVTRRGGDLIDWYLVRLPRNPCGDDGLDVSVHTTPPREGAGMYLTARLFDARLRPLYSQGSAIVRTKRTLHAGSVSGGRYFLRIAAGSNDSAGAYELTVRQAATSTCGPARDIYAPRPEDAPPPPVMPHAVTTAVTSAGMARDGVPSLVIDASDRRIEVGTRGVLLGARGEPVRDSDLVVDEVFVRGDARFAAVRFVHAPTQRRRMLLGWDLWTAALQRRDR